MSLKKTEEAQKIVKSIAKQNVANGYSTNQAITANPPKKIGTNRRTIKNLATQLPTERAQYESGHRRPRSGPCIAA